MNWLGEHYGNLASVIGLVFTFGVLVLAAQTQRKITDAKRLLVEKMNYLEIFWAINNLELLFAELVAFLDGKVWLLAADRCKLIVRSLFVLREGKGLSAEEKMTFRRGVDDLRMIKDAVEAKARKSDPYHLDAKKKSVIDGLSLAVAEIKEKMKKDVKEG